MAAASASRTDIVRNAARIWLDADSGTATPGSVASASTAAAGGLPNLSTKRAKKSSATLAAAPSTSREPICASLPPTCDLT